LFSFNVIFFELEVLEQLLMKINPQKHRLKYNSNKWGKGTVADAYNLSYSGGRDPEDHGSRPAQTKSLCNPIPTNKAGHCGAHLS
jgi:hypothetical protein